MRPRVLTLLLARVLLLLLHDASADLPVHCLHQQILGRWVFHVGAAQDLLHPGLGPPSACGHHLPGTKEDVMVEPSSALKATEAYEITLTDPDVVTDNAGRRGFWTMVYDEGYEVQIGGRSFFAFSRFHPSRDLRDNMPLAAKDTAGFASDCSMTAVGWFLDNGTRWGCYYGQQVSGAEGKPLGARPAAEVEAVPEEQPIADPWTDRLQGSFLQQQEEQQLLQQVAQQAQQQQAQQQQAQQAQQTQEQQTQEQQQTQALQAAQQQQGLMSAAFALPTPSGSGSLLSSGEQAAERQGPPNPVAMVTLPEKAIALPEMATALEKRLAMVRDVLSKFHSVGTAGMPDSMALLARESDRPEVSDD